MIWHNDVKWKKDIKDKLIGIKQTKP